MTADKKLFFPSKNILNILFLLSFVLSQIFYLNVWYQKGLGACAAHLAPAIPGPHIHEVLQNPSLFSYEQHHYQDAGFETIQTAFAWPAPIWGYLTGIGVMLTTFVFNFFNWIVLNVVFFLFYLALILSPVIFPVSFILWLVEGRPYFKKKKSFIIVLASFFLVSLLTAVVGLNLHSSSNWRRSLVFGAIFLMKDAGFYLNPVVYGILTMIFDYWLVRKCLSFLKPEKDA